MPIFYAEAEAKVQLEYSPHSMAKFTNFFHFQKEYPSTSWLEWHLEKSIQLTLDDFCCQGVAESDARAL
jgi:hypothetical protein